MPDPIRIDYENESVARAAVARVSTIAGAEQISVKRDGASVEFAVASPLVDGIVDLITAAANAFRYLRGKAAERLSGSPSCS